MNGIYAKWFSSSFKHHGASSFIERNNQARVQLGCSYPVYSFKEAGRDIVHGFHELSRVSFLNFKKIHNNKFVYTYRVK